MSLFHFHPRLWPTLLVLPMLAVLIGLGAWQLERRAWKADLLDRIDQRITAPAVPLPAAIEDPDAWEYRHVRVTGMFLHDRELHVLPRTLDGQVGAHVVTPLRRTGGVAPGQIVLVNRGWVPTDRTDPATRPASLVEGPVTVEGVVRVPGGQGWLQPDNEPARNRWYWIDLPAMAAAAGAPEAPPVLMDAVAAPGDPTLPVGGQTIVDIPNNHLQYALTWFTLAAALLAVYVLYHVRRPADAGPRP